MDDTGLIPEITAPKTGHSIPINIMIIAGKPDILIPLQTELAAHGFKLFYIGSKITNNSPTYMIYYSLVVL